MLTDNVVRMSRNAKKNSKYIGIYILIPYVVFLRYLPHTGTGWEAFPGKASLWASPPLPPHPLNTTHT